MFCERGWVGQCVYFVRDLEKNPSKRGSCMAWPTHEDHFQSTFQLPPKSKVAFLQNYIRFWYDKAGFGRLVEVVDMEDLWHLEKKPFKTGKLTFQLPPMSNVASESTKKLSGFGTIMLVLAGLWKLWTWKTSGTLAWPTHEHHFQSTFQFPPMSNVASDSTKKL